MFNLKITKMKKLITSLCLLVLIGISVNVMGANDGRTPFIGSKFTYSATTNLASGGSTFVWEVRKSTVSGTNVLGTEVTGTGSVTTTGTITASIELTWATAVPGTTYFVIVKETASGANGGCTNTKAYAVIPQNAIELDIVSMEQSGGVYTPKAIGVLASTACAADVVVTSWDGVDVSTEAKAQDFTYTFGKTYLFYQINARNVTDINWKPSIVLTNTNSTTSATDIKYGTTAPSGTGNQASYNPLISGTTSIPKGTTTIYIQVEVDNKTSKTSGVEGLLAQNFKATLSGTDNNGNPVSKINATVLTTDDNANNEIKARPTTSKITTP